MKNDGKTITELSDELLAKVTGGTASETEISQEEQDKMKAVLVGLQKFFCNHSQGIWNEEKKRCE